MTITRRITVAFGVVASLAGTVAALSCQGAPLTLEDISPHVSPNTPIIWHVPGNLLPKDLWTYKKAPQVFSESIISNAIVLASLQAKGFPKPSTNEIVIFMDPTKWEPEPPYFMILPDSGQMSFTLGDRKKVPPEEISKDDAAVQRAWDCLLQIGMDRTQFVKTNASFNGTYGVFLPRQIDGIVAHDECEGFQIQYDAHGRVLQFCLIFPNLERFQSRRVATAQQIIACIRAYKTPALPYEEEHNYLGRIKRLAKAKKLTITKLTPYYEDGTDGKISSNGESSKMVMPIAELEAVADFGSSNTTFRLLSPILSSEVESLLGR